MKWIQRFGLHLAAAIGATGIFVAATAVGAMQTHTAITARATQTAVSQTARPSPTSAPRVAPVAARRPPAKPAASAANKERVIGGVILSVGARGILVQANSGIIWRVAVSPNTLIRRQGKNVAVRGLKHGDRVYILGLARPNDVMLAHAIAARPG